METSPLGCAEWIRFYGRLLGNAEKSDSIFNAVCKEYEELLQMTADITERPKLMCELKSSSAWYVPGNKSTMGQMYNAAGADYLFSEYDVNGSVPLSVEVVLDKAADADIWLLKYNSVFDKKYPDLLAEYDGYAHFKPFRNRNIYACNTHRNNIFEETAFHPEKLLRELVALFHPILLPEYKTLYYEKMR
jgi:iron complex transport system substrate-binding protein